MSTCTVGSLAEAALAASTEADQTNKNNKSHFIVSREKTFELRPALSVQAAGIIFKKYISRKFFSCIVATIFYTKNSFKQIEVSEIYTSEEEWL
jgi:hypothetical protein